MNLCVRLICYSSLAWPLLACSLQDPNLEELRRLCEKDAGVNIYRSVDADGYYDGEKKGGSLEVLVRSDFEFIEFCDENPVLKTVLQEPGCARYTRVPADSGRCDPKVQHILDNSAAERYAAFRKESCVELELLDKPEARYFYETDLKTWSAEDKSQRFTRIHVRISDTETTELMGEYISYSLVPTSSYGVSKSCYHLSDEYSSFAAAKLVERVLMQSEN